MQHLVLVCYNVVGVKAALGVYSTLFCVRHSFFVLDTAHKHATAGHYLQGLAGNGDCGSVVSRSDFQSGGWWFNPRPSQGVLEQDTSS